MKSNLVLAAALAALSISSPATSAALIGTVVDFSHENAGITYSSSTQTVANGTSDTAAITFADGISGYTANLDANSLMVDFSGPAATVCVPRRACVSSDNVFVDGPVGLVLSSSTFDFSSLISGMTVSNTGGFGFTTDRVSAYGTNGLLFNFGGLSYNDASGFTATFASAAAAVPEPATWALMLLGFSAVGIAMRRRRKPALSQIA